MNTYDMTGRVAVVTGAARGIGSAIAEALAKSGAKVALWDVNNDGVESQAQRLSGEVNGAEIVPIHVDLSDASSVLTAADESEAKLGHVDCLINSAALVYPEKPFFETSDQEFLDVFNVNMVGIHRACSRFIPPMVQHGFGRVVNLGSTTGKYGTENMSSYSASKAAIINYTKVIGRELAQSGVLVNCVVPAATRTEGLNSVSDEQISRVTKLLPMGRLGEPEEIAALVAWLCTKDCSFSTGATFDVTGGRSFY